MAKSNSDAARQRREYWLELLRRWETSGLSQAQFCRRHRIPVWKFAWWKQRLKADGPEADDLFVPLGVAQSTAASDELELRLRGGRVLRFGSDVEVAKLADIVAALEGLPC